MAFNLTEFVLYSVHCTRSLISNCLISYLRITNGNYEKLHYFYIEKINISSYSSKLSGIPAVGAELSSACFHLGFSPNNICLPNSPDNCLLLDFLQTFVWKSYTFLPIDINGR